MEEEGGVEKCWRPPSNLSLMVTLNSKVPSFPPTPLLSTARYPFLLFRGIYQLQSSQPPAHLPPLLYPPLSWYSQLSLPRLVRSGCHSSLARLSVVSTPRVCHPLSLATLSHASSLLTASVSLYARYTVTGCASSSLCHASLALDLTCSIVYIDRLLIASVPPPSFVKHGLTPLPQPKGRSSPRHA
jgi:hypothetical protein